MFKEEDKRQAEHILDVDLDKLETDMVRLLSGIFSRLSEGKITMKRMRELFGEQESRIFELMQEIKTIRIKQSALKAKRKKFLFSFLIYTRVNTPDCGLCFYVRNYIIEAAERAGFKVGKEGDLWEVLIGSKKDPAHCFMAVRGKGENIALDLCSGQFVKDNRGRIVIAPLALYNKFITEVEEQYRTLAKARLAKLKSELDDDNTVVVLFGEGKEKSVVLKIGLEDEKRALERIKSSA